MSLWVATWVYLAWNLQGGALRSSRRIVTPQSNLSVHHNLCQHVNLSLPLMEGRGTPTQFSACWVSIRIPDYHWFTLMAHVQSQPTWVLVQGAATAAFRSPTIQHKSNVVKNGRQSRDGGREGAP